MGDRVEQVIDDVIRPLVEADGGQVTVEKANEDEVVLALHAACVGCPGAYYTRAYVIEPALRQAVGEGVRVEVRFVPGPPADSTVTASADSSS